MMFLVPVDAADKVPDPNKAPGTLQSISPPEMRDALRMAIAADIDAKVPKSRLKAWLRVLMSTHVQFEVMEGNRMAKVFQSLVQGREDVCVKCENSRVTSLLRVYEVMDFKRQLSKVSGSDGKATVSVTTLVDNYQRIKFAKMSEPVSSTFIGYAVTVYNAVLVHPEIAKLLQAFDNLSHNPLDSLYKLRLVMLGCDKHRERMHWVFSFLYDHHENVVLLKALEKHGPEAKHVKESIPLRSLQDGSPEHVSYVRLFLMKRTLREHLWRLMDVNYNWETSVKSEIRRVTESVEVVRELLGFLDAAVQPQVAYQTRASWPESANRFLMVFETLVFGYQYDDSFCSIIRNRKAAEEVLTLPETRTCGSLLMHGFVPAAPAVGP